MCFDFNLKHEIKIITYHLKIQFNITYEFLTTLYITAQYRIV